VRKPRTETETLPRFCISSLYLANLGFSIDRLDAEKLVVLVLNPFSCCDINIAASHNGGKSGSRNPGSCHYVLPYKSNNYWPAVLHSWFHSQTVLCRRLPIISRLGMTDL
jgi:hypothetical protein